MSKFTFRLKDRMKLTVEKVSPRVCLFIVSGKHTYTFRVSSKKAKEVVCGLEDCLEDCIIFGRSKIILLDGNMNTGEMMISCDNDNEYQLIITCENKKVLDYVFNKKSLKKVYKTMKEVFEIE